MRHHYCICALSCLLGGSALAESFNVRVTNNAGGPNRKYEIRIDGVAQNLNGSFNDTVIANASKLWGPYNVFPGETLAVDINEVNGAAPSCNYLVTVANDGQELECEYTPTGSSGGGGGGGPWTWSSTITNDSPWTQDYIVSIDGVDQPEQTVFPGDDMTNTFVYSEDPPDVEIYRVEKFYDPEGDVVDERRTVVDQVTGGQGGGGYTGGGASPPANDVSDNGTSDNPPLPRDWLNEGDIIDWFPPGSTPATDETLRQGVENLADAIQEGLRRNASEIRGNRGAINSIRDEVEDGFANLDGQMTGVNQKLTQLNAAATQQATDLQGLRNDVTSGFGDQALKFDALQSSLGSIDTSTAQARDALNDVKTNLESVITKIEAGNQVSSDTLTQLNAQGLVLNEMRDGINEMTPDVEGIRATIQLIDDKLGGDIQTRLNQIEGNTANSATSLSDAVDKLEQIRLNTQRTDSNTAAASATLDQIEDHVDQVEGILSGIDASIGDVETSVDALLPPIIQIRDNTGQLVTINTDMAMDVAESKSHLEMATNILGEISGKLGPRATDENWNAMVGAVTAAMQPAVDDLLADAGEASAAAAAVPAIGTPGGSSFWQVSIGGQSVDLSPTQFSWFNDVTSFFRALTLWIIQVLVLWWGLRTVREAWNAVMSTARAFASGSIATTVVAIVVGAVGLATGLVAAFPKQAWELFEQATGVSIATIATSPFITSHPIIAEGVRMMNLGFPIPEALTLLFAAISFWLTLGAIQVVAQMAFKANPL